MRNMRRDAMQHLRSSRRQGEASADDEHRAEGELRSSPTAHTNIDSVLKDKEEEILEV